MSMLTNLIFAQKPITFSFPPHTIGGSKIITATLPSDINPDEYVLFDTQQNKAVATQKDGSNLIWKIPESELSQFHTYELKKGKPTPQTDVFKLVSDASQISIIQDGVKILTYQTALKEVPEGVSEAYRRSGYIHPLQTPAGKRLTRIQPKDHYHHYGIWNPWTHVLFEGDTLDFWNINGKQGTVKYAATLSKSNGPVFSEIEVLHEHVVLKNNQNKVALLELQKMRTYPINDRSYLLDLTFTYSCATDSPFKILEYRYAGLGWRTTEEWDNKNSTVLTSEGKNRKDADGSTARWCIVQGKLGDGSGGAIMLSHPANYNHPEPLRIWPENQYGRGDMFANFAPTKNKDWLLEPGKKYTLHYQFLVFDGQMSANEAEIAWQNFAHPIEINLNK